MSAFAKAWLFLKADIDFIDPNDTPEDIAYKRMWLYNRLNETPEDNPDRYAEEGGWDAIPKWDLENEPEEKWKTYRESYLDRYGHMPNTGQANTDYGYEQITTWDGRTRDDRSKPIFGEGRVLINLPNLTDSARWKLSEQYEEGNPRPPFMPDSHPDYVSYSDMPEYPSWDDPLREEKKAERDEIIQRNNRIELKNRLDRERWDRGRQAHYDENIEDTIIDGLIRMINHEVGHTTQPKEEHDWTKLYTDKGRYDVSERARGDTWNERYNDNISGLLREILMEESLASIYEDPHNEKSDWKQKVAEYSSNQLNDRHDMQREVSHSMAKFFAENPQFYRSPEQAKRERDELRALLYGGDD